MRRLHVLNTLYSSKKAFAPPEPHLATLPPHRRDGEQRRLHDGASQPPAERQRARPCEAWLRHDGRQDVLLRWRRQPHAGDLNGWRHHYDLRLRLSRDVEPPRADHARHDHGPLARLRQWRQPDLRQRRRHLARLCLQPAQPPVAGDHRRGAVELHLHA
jgi:hypothetical protein